LPESGNKSRGRPPKHDSEKRISQRLAVPRQTINVARRHVITAESYPVMQSWPQYHVLEAKSYVEKLPEPERPKAVEIIAQPGIPSGDSVALLRNLATSSLSASPCTISLRSATIGLAHDSQASRRARGLGHPGGFADNTRYTHLFPVFAPAGITGGSVLGLMACRMSREAPDSEGLRCSNSHEPLVRNDNRPDQSQGACHVEGDRCATRRVDSRAIGLL